MPELWNSKEPSFALIRKQQGTAVVKTMLYAELFKLKELIKADMDEVHIDYLADYLLSTYYYFSISDLTIITSRLLKNHPYGKPILQNIIFEIDKYSQDRDMFAQEFNRKLSQEHKQVDDSDNLDMVKIYKRLKKEALGPKKSQKEKDSEAREELAKKKVEFDKIYK